MLILGCTVSLTAHRSCSSDDERDTHLAVVQLLDDSFVLFVDVADADELGLAVSLEEAFPEPLHHARRRAPAGNRTVLDVPEHPDGRQRLLRSTCGHRAGRPEHTHTHSSLTAAAAQVRTVFLRGSAQTDPQQTVAAAVAHRDGRRDVRPNLLRVPLKAEETGVRLDCRVSAGVFHPVSA